VLTRGARAGRAVRAQRQAKLQAALEELMTLVLRTVNDKKDHIPPVVSSAVLTFSFDISVAGCAGARAAACSACLCQL
jgi:autophagy-related protein 101